MAVAKKSKSLAVPQGATAVTEQGMFAAPASRSAPIVRGGTSAGTPGKAVSAANRWRENYNPLRQLTIRRAVELLEMAQRGDTALLQWTFRFIERRHPTLAALVERCEAPLLNYDWEIKVLEELPTVPGKSADQVKKMAEAQRETLKEAYDLIDNLKDAVAHLHLAQFRGYAHLQKHRTPDGDVYHMEPLDQWTVCRDGLYGDWFWNPTSRFVTHPAATLGEANRIGGDQLPREDFLVREVSRPIDEIAIINFIRANLCEKDWDGFVEIYGIPGGVVVMPPNVPQGKETEYEDSARKVAEGGSGAIPNGADYKANDGPRGVDPFTPRLKWLEEQLVLAGTGGKLTMLAESGSGTLAGGAHTDTFDEIASARAKRISEIFQRQFDTEVLAREHPGEPMLAFFRWGATDEDSSDTIEFQREIVKSFSAHEILARVLANQTDLKEAVRESGLPVNEEYTDPYVPVVDSNGQGISGELERDPDGDIIGAEIGDAREDDGDVREAVPTDVRTDRGDARPTAAKDDGDVREAVPTSKTLKNRGTAPSAALVDSGLDAYAEALARDLEAMRERVAALDQISDDNILRQRALDLAGEIDQLKADITKLPSSAQALAQVMVAAFASGLTGNRRILNGDQPGHPFHGNQYQGGTSIGEVLSGKSHEAIYAQVDPKVAARIKSATGRDVSGFSHHIDGDAIIHIHRQHGQGKEDQPGHEPVTAADIQRIPEIVSNPDKVEPGRTARGMPAIKYTKRFNGTTYYVEEEWTKDKVLAAKTMWKEKK